jgi:hypothetical protein
VVVIPWLRFNGLLLWPAGCFPHFYVFAGLAIVLFIVTRVFSMLMHWKSERQAQKKAAQKAVSVRLIS